MSHTVRDGYARKSCAARKSNISNVRHTVRYRHVRQTGAIIESLSIDARHTTRNRYTGQASAAVECTTSNVRNTVRHGHTLQVATSQERTIPDVRHSIGDCHARQPIAVSKGVTSNARHAVRYRHVSRLAHIAVQYTPQDNEPVRIRKTDATGKRPVLDARHAVRNSQARQPPRHGDKSASIFRQQQSVNRLVAQILIGDVKGHQTATAFERLIPYTHHAIRYSHARKTAAAVKHISPDARHRLAAERSRNSHDTCWRWRDGSRMVIVNLCRVTINAICPSIAADSFRRGHNRQRGIDCRHQHHQLFHCPAILPRQLCKGSPPSARKRRVACLTFSRLM